MNLSKSLRTLPLLLAFATISASTPLLVRHALAVDAPTFPMPTEVPSGTTLKIQASSSMEQFTRNLADNFQSKFAGAKVETATESSDAALKALLDGKVDLAAIGRPLTEEEKAQGLTAVPIARNKIAMIVGKDNPFTQGLDINLFAKIFRGEITDWKDVGGQPGPIRLVDRPETSDTRQAFAVYPVFQGGLPASKPESSAKEDTTAAVVQELGNDGIGFAIADQVVNDPNVRVLPMHKVMPDDQRYPFSQPLQYVYRGEANPGVQAFLGYLMAPENKEAVEKARLAAIGVTTPIAAASPTAPAGSPAVSPEGSPTISAQAPAAGTSPAAETGSGGLPGWWPWLLAIPAGGALIWALKGKGGADTETPATTAAAPAAPPVPPLPDINPAAVAATAVAGTAAAVGAATMAGATSASRPLARRLILTPRNSSDAYAYWEVDDQIKQELQDQGGEQLKLRLTDVTGLAPDQTPPVIGEFNCQENDPDLHVPITTPNRDYQAELGYRTTDGRWLSIAKSDPVLVPNTPPSGSGTMADANIGSGVGDGLHGIGAAIAGAGAAAVAGAAGLGSSLFGQRETDTPTTPSAEGGDDSGGLFGDLFGKATDTAKGLAEDTTSTISNLFEDGTAAVGGAAAAAAAGLGLGGAAQTPTTPTSEPSPEAAEADQEGGLFGDLFGKVTDTAKGLTGDATSTISNLFEDGTAAVGGAVAGAAAVGAAGIGAVSQAFNRSEAPAAPQAPGSAKDCRIILVPRNSQDAYAYWEVADKYKSVLRQQGGQRLTIRVHDATNIDIDSQAPHGTQEYPVLENQQDLHVKIPATNRDYVVELGYYTSDNRWMRIIRSLHVHVA